MTHMNLTAKNIRLYNLEQLIRQSELSQVAFAELVDTAPTYISQILRKDAVRGMGDCLARKIETRLGKPKGWMDSLHHAEADADSVKKKFRKNIRRPGMPLVLKRLLWT